MRWGIYGFVGLALCPTVKMEQESYLQEGEPIVATPIPVEHGKFLQTGNSSSYGWRVQSGRRVA